MKTIVVGVDASERNGQVLDEALKLAVAFDAKILAVRAVGIPIELPYEAFSIRPDQLETSIVEGAKQSLARALTRLPAERLLQPEVHLGAPWQVVCETAARVHADLVVVGTHTRNAIDRVLGTTSARIVNHAPCAVFVVR